jgi:hypothetical protein
MGLIGLQILVIALTRAVEAGAGVIFAKPCRWGSGSSYMT